MSCHWLRERLSTASGVTLDGNNSVLLATFAGRTERIYCPSSDEYTISADIVQKAKELGATIIAHADSWSSATEEAKEYAKSFKISIMKYSRLFGYMRRKGVKLESD